MARMLVLDADTVSLIANAVARAAKNPVGLDVVMRNAVPAETTNLTLKDRVGATTIRPASQLVRIPYGYRAAFSMEEQPVGLVRHLSVSVDTPGKLPSVEAFTAIAEAFGMPSPFLHIWTEEFDPGHSAVNALKLVESDQHTGRPN